MQLFYLWSFDIVIVLSAVVIPVSTAPFQQDSKSEDVLRAKTLTPLSRADGVDNKSGQKSQRSNSFAGHILGNLQNNNKFVYLSSLPAGVYPPQGEVPILTYAFVNPKPNERPLHWTETLERFQNNPIIKDNPELQDKFKPILNLPNKIYGEGTESRFPLVLEYFVQRIQNYFSNYVYEDLSRPAPFDTDLQAADKKNVSSMKEEQTTVKDTGMMDYIVDINLSPNMDIMANATDDFDEVTEEWEEGTENFNDSGNTTETTTSKVVVEKETIDLKLIHPIELEDNSYIYVGDGTGDELNRSGKKNIRKSNKQ